LYPDFKTSNAGFSIVDAMIGLAIFSIGLMVIMSEVSNQAALETKAELSADMIDMEDLFRAALARRYAGLVEGGCSTIKPSDLVQNVLPAPWTNTTNTELFKFNAAAPDQHAKIASRCRSGSAAADGNVRLCALFKREEPGLPPISILIEARLEPRDLQTGTTLGCTAHKAREARGIAGVYGMFVESKVNGTDYVYHESVGQILSGSRED